jgi:hypothetical protein
MSFAFTQKYSSMKNRLMTPIEIKPSNSVLPNMGNIVLSHKGLWDTGASSSCIKEEFAKENNFIPIS